MIRGLNTIKLPDWVKEKVAQYKDGEFGGSLSNNIVHKIKKLYNVVRDRKWSSYLSEKKDSSTFFPFFNCLINQFCLGLIKWKLKNAQNVL